MVPDVGRMAFRRFGFVQSSVVSRWAEIVGAQHARWTAPESIRFPHGRRDGGTLTVVVSSAHAPMIQHAAPVIMERVNRFFGYSAVAKVTLRQGMVAAANPRPAPRDAVPVPVELGESLRTVADPELRAVLGSLAQAIGAATPPTLGKIS